MEDVKKAKHLTPGRVALAVGLLTFMVYLNDEFEGGETTIEKLDVQPEKGLALLFFHHVRHKGQPVVRGRKYVLRTDVMYQLTEPMEE